MSVWGQGNMGAPLVSIVSASGGVGKSTVALLSAWLSSTAGIRTVLVEADLQFGDMGFWLGLDDELPDLGLGSEAKPVQVKEGLSLYKAPCFPEVAEEVSEEVAGLVPRLRTGSELVIADTGQFWSGLTAELVCNSEIVLVVVDTRSASVVGAVKARELLVRLGVPSSRCACVYNRWTSRAKLSVGEVSRGVGVDRVMCVPDGKGAVEALVSADAVSELVEAGNPAVLGIDALLADTLPRMGLLYAGGSWQHRRKGLFK